MTVQESQEESVIVWSYRGSYYDESKRPNNLRFLFSPESLYTEVRKFVDNVNSILCYSREQDLEKPLWLRHNKGNDVLDR